MTVKVVGSHGLMPFGWMLTIHSHIELYFLDASSCGSSCNTHHNAQSNCVPEEEEVQYALHKIAHCDCLGELLP